MHRTRSIRSQRKSWPSGASSDKNSFGHARSDLVARRGDKLSPRARRAIANPEVVVLVSAASAWKIAIKHRGGKFQVPDLLKNFRGRVEREGFVELPISMAHAVMAGGLPGPHKHPFDRLLIAQSVVEDATMISRDSRLSEYAVQCIW